MSDTFVLKAESRKKVGTKSSAALREQGKMPAVIYGHKQDTVSVALDGHEFVEALHHGHRLFDISVDGKADKVLLKDVQYDHFGKDIIHADLVRVDLSETVTVTVPLSLKGTAVGTTEGGIIDEVLTEIEVECVVTSIPEVIEVNIKDINVGDSVHAGEIKLPEGVKLVTDESALILTCHVVAAAKTTEELEGEEATAPEVITEKKKEEE